MICEGCPLVLRIEGEQPQIPAPVFYKKKYTDGEMRYIECNKSIIQ